MLFLSKLFILTILSSTLFNDSLYKLISNFPSIPGKSFFKVSSAEALNKRRLELEQFLIKCAARKDIFMNQLFKDFIEIDKQAADLSSNQVTLKFEYKKINCKQYRYFKYIYFI